LGGLEKGCSIKYQSSCLTSCTSHQLVDCLLMIGDVLVINLVNLMIYLLSLLQTFIEVSANVVPCF
jgi:hypothetical protein